MSEKKYDFGTKSDCMDISEYLERINGIATYYFERCEYYKKRFYFCCFARLLASALIPIISLGAEVNWSSIAVSVLAAIITLTEGYVNVSRAYEKWTSYRSTCNALWIEQRYFSMKVGIYSDSKERTACFVNRCESLMQNEVNEWRQYIERAKEMR